MCIRDSPVGVHIPDFITHVKEGEFEKAYETIRLTNNLPAICGRVCPQETQCESKCVRGVKGDPVGIGRLERFCADYAMQDVYKRQRSCRFPSRWGAGNTSTPRTRAASPTRSFTPACAPAKSPRPRRPTPTCSSPPRCV